jgi:hypothetical protein
MAVTCQRTFERAGACLNDAQSIVLGTRVELLTTVSTALLTIATETTATPRAVPKAKSEAACISTARTALSLHLCNCACVSL